jgi:O-antigen/teichoic acid export membrane protein
MLDKLKYIYTRLTADGSTGEQAVRSGVWVTGINVGDRVLQILKLVLLARLLSPTAFGLLGIALLVVAALKQFSQLGFDEALIQHRDENVDGYLNTAWVMKVLRGLLIAVVAFAFAPYISEFFDEPQAHRLIQVLGVSPLILGLQNPAVVYFEKHLNFHKDFVYQVGGRLVDLVVAALFALAFRSVWALVAGIVAMNLARFAISYAIHPYRPTIEFDLERGREMFGFGKWMFASSILMFLYGQGDDVFVGWFFTASTLGFYQLAYRFSNAPASEVTQVISRVAFPAFSKVQDDVDRLRNGYFRAVQLSSIVAFPMAAGIAAVAPQFVHAALGTQWAPMVPLMQVLAVWGAIRAFGANVGAVFKAIGRPDFDVRLQVIKTATIALTIYPAAEYFGVLGVAFVIVGSSFVVQPIALHLVLSSIDGELGELLGLVAYPLVGSVCMFAAVVGVDTFLLARQGLVELLVLIGIGAVSYTCFMISVENWTGYEFVGLYREVRRSL